MHWDDFVKYFTKLALEFWKLHINAKKIHKYVFYVYKTFHHHQQQNDLIFLQ